jgi:phage terminase large subunit-like protein
MNSLRGAARPRVELIPPSVGTRAEAAIRLSALAGLPLEPWQAEGLRAMLSVREDGRWAAFEYGEICPRQNGKTALFMARALAGLLLLDERLVVWSAHEYKTTMRSFLDLQGLLATLGERVRDNMFDLDGILIKVDNNNGHESLERLDTGQMVKMVARSKGSGRGFSVDCMLIDEAFAYTAAQQSALMPTLQARPNPQICYASSPPLDRWTGEPMYALRTRATRGDADLAWRDWGLADDLDSFMALPEDDRHAYLDRRDLWAATNPALGLGRVSEEAILRSRRSMSVEGFAREILGMWPLPAAGAGGKIPITTWSERRDGDSRIVGRAVFAIELSQDRATASIFAAGRRSDGRAHLELAEDRPGAGIEWVVDRAVEMQERNDPFTWMIDPSGPAGAFTTELATRGIDLTPVTGREYVQACGEFFDAVIGDRVRHLGQQPMDAAVRAARARDVGDGAWAWARRDSPADISRVIGATLAHHGLLLHTGADYDVLESVW